MIKNIAAIQKDYIDMTNKLEEMATSILLLRAKRNGARALLKRLGIDPETIVSSSSEGESAPLPTADYEDDMIDDELDTLLQ